MKSTGSQQVLSKPFLPELLNFGKKIDISSFKKIVDTFFEFSEVIVIKLPKLISRYLDFYEDLIDEEIKIGNIKSNSKVVHIGSGPVPATSILIAKKTGAKVICIDKNQKAIKQARFIVEKLGLSNKIEIKHAEASDFDIKAFNVILISHGISPIEKFLSHISKTMKDDTIAVFRTFSSDFEKLIRSDSKFDEMFKIGKIATYEKHGSVISVALYKK